MSLLFTPVGILDTKAKPWSPPLPPVNKVTIDVLIDDGIDVYNKYERLEVRVNGDYVGGGVYGGEPEDNCRTRDYMWIEHLIADLAIKLGAEVTLTVKY